MIAAAFVRKNEMFTFDNALVRHDGKEFSVKLDLQRNKKKSKRKNRNNHVKMIADTKWKQINRQCRFRKDKMIRFKLVSFMESLDETVDKEFPVLLPVFDMC